jgi:hypothetical protein
MAVLTARTSRRELALRLVWIGYALALAALLALPAFASDGRLEINEACIATGCFPGDAPGLPVTTAADGSYVLTSSITLPNADSVGIQLASGSTLDLGGFTIAGPVACSGTPTTCSAATGVGVLSSNATNVTIRNGTIRGAGRYGVRAGEGTRLEHLVIEQNELDGVIADAGPAAWRITDCIIQRNGRHGLNFAYGNGAEGSIVRDSVLRRNGSQGAIGGFSLVEHNAITYNAGRGITVGYDDGNTAVSGNQFSNNNGGNGNDQLSGGFITGTNVCGNSTTCP